MKFLVIRLSALFILLLLPAAARAAGLSTTMGRVFIRNVPVGSTVSLNGLTGMSYKVTNTSRNAEDVLVSILVPAIDSGSLVKGYAPLPAGARVWLSKDAFELAPGQQGASDVMIYIPKSEAHLEKKYQVNIWARNKPKGRFLSVGLKSRLLLTVSPSLRTPVELKHRREVISDLDFHLTPFEMAVTGVPLGRRVDITREFKKKFRIINLSDTAFRVRIKRTRQKLAGLKTIPGVIDDVGGIWGASAELAIAPNSIGLIPFSVEIPADEKYAGKTIRFILEAELLDYAIPVSAYGQVFVTTKPTTKKRKKK